MSRAMRTLRLVLLAAAMGTGVALAQPTMEAATMEAPTMQPRGATMATVTSAMVEAPDAPSAAPTTPAAVRSELRNSPMLARMEPGQTVAVGVGSRGIANLPLLVKATVFTDEVAQSISIGEAQHAVAQGLIAEADVNQIGAVINGTHAGRKSAEEITLFDGTGVGLQDLAVAAAVVDLAVEKGIAIEVDF